MAEKKSFETRLTALEELVKKMEEGGLPLNDTLSLYEKGVKLEKELEKELDAAQKKLQILSGGKLSEEDEA